MTQTMAPAAAPSLARRLSKPALVGAAIVGVVGVVAAIDPNQPGHYPMCPFLAITGLYCPGCGSLRALHDLAHGDPLGALSRNPFALVLFAGLAWGYLRWVRQAATGRYQAWQMPTWLVYGLPAAVVVFTVLRNIPGWTWLSPG